MAPIATESTPPDIRTDDMAPSTSSVSQSLLALALSIQKSKPDGISTKEYCMRLRKHVKLAQPSVEDKHSYIDTAAFWKDQAAMLHDEKEKLKQELCDVKDELYACKESQVTPPTKSGIFSGASEKGEVSHKRKAEEQLEESEDGEPEPVSYPDSGPVTIPDVQLDPRLYANPMFRFADIQRSDFKMLKYAKIIADFLKKDPNADGEVLNDLLRFSIAELRRFTNMKYNHFHSKIVDYIDNPMACGIRVFRKYSYRVVYRMVIMGVAHLCRDIQGRQRYMRPLINDLVLHFQSLIQHLGNLCKRAVHPRAERIVEYYGVGPTPTSKLFQDPPKEAIRARRLLVNWTLYIKEPISFTMQFANCSVIAEALEGFHALLIHRIGQLLSKVVFRENLASSTKPGHIGALEQHKLSTKEMLHIEEEGFHLNSLLKASKAKLQHSYDMAAFLNGSWKVDSTPGRRGLHRALKIRMQDTLLEAVFGGDKKIFRRAMKSPPPFAENDPSVADEVEGNENQADDEEDQDNASKEPVPSFVESVWMTLGWDAVSMI